MPSPALGRALDGLLYAEHMGDVMRAVKDLATALGLPQPLDDEHAQNGLVWPEEFAFVLCGDQGAFGADWDPCTEVQGHDGRHGNEHSTWAQRPSQKGS
jgi:hypothetical protein